MNWEPYVGRGVLGGMIGTLLVVIIGTIYVVVRFGPQNLGEMLVIMGVFGLASGAVAGIAVGYIIYKITGRTKTQPNAMFRIAIGTGCLLVYGLLTNITSSRPLHATFEVGYALVVGGLAGLMSRAKDFGGIQSGSHNRA